MAFLTRIKTVSVVQGPNYAFLTSNSISPEEKTDVRWFKHLRSICLYQCQLDFYSERHRSTSCLVWHSLLHPAMTMMGGESLRSVTESRLHVPWGAHVSHMICSVTFNRTLGHTSKKCACPLGGTSKNARAPQGARDTFESHGTISGSRAALPAEGRAALPLTPKFLKKWDFKWIKKWPPAP